MARELQVPPIEVYRARADEVLGATVDDDRELDADWELGLAHVVDRSTMIHSSPWSLCVVALRAAASVAVILGVALAVVLMVMVVSRSSGQHLQGSLSGSGKRVAILAPLPDTVPVVIG